MYQPKPNTGTLWPNQRKMQDNHPDIRGDIFIDLNLLKTLMPKAKDGLVKIQISGWKKLIRDQECFSLKASEPYEKTTSEDVPF